MRSFRHAQRKTCEQTLVGGKLSYRRDIFQNNLIEMVVAPFLPMTEIAVIGIFMAEISDLLHHKSKIPQQIRILSLF
jgi:uncharacterized membrane protein YGL010W